MSQVPTHHVTIAGTAPTFNAAADGDTAEVGAGCKLIVKNGAGSSMTVTVAVPGNAINAVANPDTVYTVPATTGEVWIPLYDFYADPADSLAHLTYSSTTTVTRAVSKG